MHLDEMLRHRKDEHHDGQDEWDSEDMNEYPGECEFDEVPSLQSFRDCFREDIE